MKQKLAEFIDVLMGFRKFIALMLVLLISVVFRAKGLIDGQNFTDLIKNCFISFTAANGVEHFTSMAKEYIANKTAPKDTDTAPDTN